MLTPIVTVTWSRDGGIFEEIENLLETDTAAKMQWNAFIDGKAAQEGERRPSLERLLTSRETSLKPMLEAIAQSVISSLCDEELWHFLHRRNCGAEPKDSQCEREAPWREVEEGRACDVASSLAAADNSTPLAATADSGETLQDAASSGSESAPRPDTPCRRRSRRKSC